MLLFFGAAEASAETRSLDIYHLHTGEHQVIVFKRDGAYVPQGLDQLNHILRDWRRNEVIKMDPALFDLVWEVYRDTGATGPIQIVCGYRAPETNNMLRSRSRGVAKFSQHTLGKAMDFYLQGVSLEKLREVGMKKQVGGVGFYPTSGSPFVHMDTGSVRAWPRMTRDQLVRLFPDGKTLHLPSDGGPLPGYNQALAEYQRHHSGDTQVADASVTSRSSKNPIAALFGIKTSGDEDEEAAPAPTAPPQRQQRGPAPTVLAANTQNEPRPLPAPQPLKPVLANTQPHLAQKPIDQDVGPIQEPAKPVVMANLPFPPARPQMPQQMAIAATPVSLSQPGLLVPSQRAPGAILPTGTEQAIAALKQINVPIPAAKPSNIIASIAKPRPAVATASPGPRSINDAFTALTGTPPETDPSAMLGYAPTSSQAMLDGRASISRDQATRLRLASLGAADLASAPAVGSNQTAKQPRAAEMLPKADRGDPMARLISHVTEDIDVRFLDGRSSLRSAATATFIHPDQDTMPQMIVKPTEVLADTFGHSPTLISTDRFVGNAVVALAVIETH